jgi:uncharacterized Zn finger protein
MNSRWGQRFAEQFEQAHPGAGQSQVKGRALLRSGRVTDVRVRTGLVSARVQGSRATPLTVTLRQAPLDNAQWQRVLVALASQVRHTARLLAGQVPEGLEAELEAANVSLFGTVTADCTDGRSTCEHIAAVWLAAAERIAADPFELLRLRGRGRERLLVETVTERSRGGAGAPRSGVDPARLDPSAWTRASIDPLSLELGLEPEPRTPAGLLRLLGDPPGWAGGVSAGDLFAPLVIRAAAWARHLATADDAGDEPGGSGQG